MTLTTFILVLLGLVAIGSAVGMLLSRNTVYSALLLVLNFGTVALFYILLGAPFIAMAQITVYAGAIMVLFIFVIMLLGAEFFAHKENLPRHRLFGFLLGLVFLIEGVLVLIHEGANGSLLNPPPAGYASPQDLGLLLFNQYALPFEITSVILLVAVIGAIILTQRDAPPPPNQEPPGEKG